MTMMEVEMLSSRKDTIPLTLNNFHVLLSERGCATKNNYVSWVKEQSSSSQSL